MSWPIPLIPEPVVLPRPRLLVWLWPCLLIMAGVCLLILKHWPQTEPTQTPWFWFCTGFVPFVCGVLPYGIRYHFWEWHASKVEYFLELREYTLADWHAWARRSLLLVDGAALLPEEPPPAAPQGGAVPDKKPGLHIDEILPLTAVTFGGIERRDAKAWTELLRRLESALRYAIGQTQGKPPEVFLDGFSLEYDVEDVFLEAWGAAGLPGKPKVHVLDAPLAALWAEQWIDAPTDYFRLLVSTRLFEDFEPPETEMALMLLFAPNHAAKNKAYTGKAWLRRPVLATADSMEKDLAAMFTAGQAPAGTVGALWCAHAGADLRAPLTQALLNQGVVSTQQATHSLDDKFGRFGDAGGLAAIALALQSLQSSGPSLVASGCQDGLLLNFLISAGDA